ncbi:sensor histidine kinase [Streptomonospora nanhaiensis]|uniref:histidine kinase n=1 Tax=Streptomonospora nanhaiensis TaxID=1323731 RepID=A0A853BUN2_9ACTN|nr:sensor histidine kinase [Streptomonospora nanhaiensis]MBX9390322.1 sensor histidine kinase [Streptomonospora nanhaiensis]NYI98694.1 signal transduction histidine kinase [Streptomonospora nanhaiensis]
MPDADPHPAPPHGRPWAGEPRRRDLVALDALAAAAYLLAALAAPSPLGAAGWAAPLMAAVGPPLALRRVWPVPVLAVVAAGAAAAVLAGGGVLPFAAVAFALYPVALKARRRRFEPTPTVGAAGMVVIVLATATGTPACCGPLPSVLLLGVPALVGTWALARVMRERRTAAARWAAELAERAVAEERLRIARELHDSVAHSMSVIAVKAGIANHVAESRPEEARAALRVIEATSRDALGEMRQVLGVLRAADEDPRSGEAGGGPPGAAPAALAPLPGTDALPALVERAAMAGVRVDLAVRGAEALSEQVGAAVYRIVQESVTNVVKHAAPARCAVRVEAARGRVRVEVTDDGPGARVLPAAAEGGHGLIGMRERVAVYGGTFAAGPRPEGGFRVAAEFPLPEARPGAAAPERAAADA